MVVGCGVAGDELTEGVGDGGVLGGPLDLRASSSTRSTVAPKVLWIPDDMSTDCGTIAGRCGGLGHNHFGRAHGIEDRAGVHLMNSPAADGMVMPSGYHEGAGRQHAGVVQAFRAQFADGRPGGQDRGQQTYGPEGGLDTLGVPGPGDRSPCGRP